MDVDRNSRAVGDGTGSGRLPAAMREESFLARWSQRKALARNHAAMPEESGTEQTADAVPEAAARESSVVPKTDADMPPVETLNADSDYAQFLSPEVSEQLRQAALRKLFHLPHFNLTDGLDDYAGDYRDFSPLGDIVTAEMRHRLENLAKEEQAQREAEATGANERREDFPAEKRAHLQGEAPDARRTPASKSARPTARNAGGTAKSARRGKRKSKREKAHG